MKDCPRVQLVTALLLICCSVFIGSCSGPGRGGQEKRQGPGGPDGPGRGFFSTVFDAKPFNMSVDKLEPMYTGHNPELLYNNIRMRKERVSRDANETREQYRIRIGQEISRPLMGTMDFDSVYAFRITPGEALYNTKDQVMQLRCPLSAAFEGGREEKSKKAFMVRYQPLLDNRYTITDSHGAKTEVEEIKFREYAVVPVNAGALPVEKLSLRGVKEGARTNSTAPGSGKEEPGRENIAETIRMTPEDAKRFEGSIMALLVCRLAEPYISYEEIGRAPATEKPGVYLARYHYIYVQLIEIWFYDAMSGKILKKTTTGTKTPSSH